MMSFTNYARSTILPHHQYITCTISVWLLCRFDKMEGLTEFGMWSSKGGGGGGQGMIPNKFMVTLSNKNQCNGTREPRLYMVCHLAQATSMRSVMTSYQQ